MGLSPVRTEVYFVYVGGELEKDCKTLNGARASVKALERRGMRAHVVRAVSENGRSWNEPVEDKV